MSKIDHSLFAANAHALEAAYGRCPECDQALAIKHGKSGPFLGCSGYPECHFSKPLHEHEDATLKLIDGSECPLCHAVLAVKRGRYGLFIGCSQFPVCHYIEKLNTQEDSKITCPQCKQGHLVKRINKYGKHFYACDQYPKCKYLLNAEPVAESCPSCGFKLLQQRSVKGRMEISCANKTCNYKKA